MEESDRIKALIKGDPKAQNWFYDRFSPMVYAICLRYLPTVEDAQDVTLSGLFRAMEKVRQFNSEGSFEGWVRRIAVRECLMFLRKARVHIEELDVELSLADDAIRADERLQLAELMELITQLPEGYRLVFQLYEIEGYKHREIAEELGISINTSKSQLIMAKRRLQEMINEKYQ